MAGGYVLPATVCLHGQVEARSHLLGFFAECTDCGMDAEMRPTAEGALAAFGRAHEGTCTDIGVFWALRKERVDA